MMHIPDSLMEILKTYDIDIEDSNTLWDIDGKIILSHKSFEIIAEKAGVIFEKPVVLSNNDYECVLLITGTVPSKKSVWTIGEASVQNNTFPYRWCVAEKRGKDRCTAKLTGLSNYVYSESEADAFKNREINRQPDPRHLVKTAESDEDLTLVVPATPDEWETWERALLKAIHDSTKLQELMILWRRNEPAIETAKIKYSAVYGTIFGLFSRKRMEIQSKQQRQ
jgi:hypothetical protein